MCQSDCCKSICPVYQKYQMHMEYVRNRTRHQLAVGNVSCQMSHYIQLYAQNYKGFCSLLSLCVARIRCRHGICIVVVFFLPFIQRYFYFYRDGTTARRMRIWHSMPRRLIRANIESILSQSSLRLLFMPPYPTGTNLQERGVKWLSALLFTPFTVHTLPNVLQVSIWDSWGLVFKR